METQAFKKLTVMQLGLKEKPNGKSVYSLMDGASGPGGLLSKTKLTTIHIPCIVRTDLAKTGEGCINKLSSAPLFSLTDEIAIQTDNTTLTLAYTAQR